MKKRHKRIPARLEAKFTLKSNYAGSDDRLSEEGIRWNKYTGMIENLSESGMRLSTSPANTVIDFSPGTTLELEFQTLFGEIFNLNCMVKWSHKTQHHTKVKGLANTPALEYAATGMEIIEPPLKYKEFVKTRLKQHK